MAPYEGVSARCALCDGEIYRGEEYYHINGQAVCRDCLAEYAVQVFAPYLVKGGGEKWREPRRGKLICAARRSS